MYRTNEFDANKLRHSSSKISLPGAAIVSDGFRLAQEFKHAPILVEIDGFPGRFADGQLRTLQRRSREWRALEGPAKEVFFAQVHHPGRLCASDFTHCTELGVTINGIPFPHLIYHFVLTYSNWETGTICFSESLESLSEGLQNALGELGGVPQYHRTDRLTAAVQPGVEGPKAFKQRYQALLTHYGLQAQAIQAGKGNENGDVEQSHRQFKRALDQALMLRGAQAGRVCGLSLPRGFVPEQPLSAGLRCFTWAATGACGQGISGHPAVGGVRERERRGGGAESAPERGIGAPDGVGGAGGVAEERWTHVVAGSDGGVRGPGVV